MATSSNAPVVVVKIHNPFGSLLAGNLEKLQEKIDEKIKATVILYGEFNLQENLYLRKSDNSVSPADGSSLRPVLLVEYFCSVSVDNDVVRNIHQVILDNTGDQPSSIEIRCMVFEGVKMDAE